MNVYDFDKTVFNGDSTRKFYLYCLKKYPGIIKHVPSMVMSFAKYYILKKGTKTECKEVFYRFLREIPDVDGAVEEFWKKNECGIFPWYEKTKKDDDVFISAGPEFLLENFCKKLGAKTFMASRVDKKTGAYTGENCHGEEKVRRFFEKFPDGKIDSFFSDSISDLPLACVSDKAFAITKKGEVKLWEEVFPNTRNRKN